MTAETIGHPLKHHAVIWQQPIGEKKMKNLLLHILILLTVTFISCKKDDSNPVNNNSVSLNGTWKTDGIYNTIYLRPNEGSQMTLEINNNNFSFSEIQYRKDNNGNWQQYNINNQSGTFSIDYSFLILNNGGNVYTLHFSVEGNKLTLNATDNGGIFEGNSNELIGQKWKGIYNNTLEEFSYKADGSGTHLSKYFLNGNPKIDTLIFNYTISSNTISHTWTHINNQPISGREPSVCIYEIKNKKLYMYGKPFTSDNDDYFMVELFKQ
ncbi:MAG: hypothetical protein K9I95_14475 [Flavobacteriaceae bacterium]|nr:hypothetical protein [Flavobacteriaceae bacterium]MCF8428358.1 hypothetical protein [Bacteroidia bacterium]